MKVQVHEQVERDRVGSEWVGSTDSVQQAESDDSKGTGRTNETLEAKHSSLLGGCLVCGGIVWRLPLYCNVVVVVVVVDEGGIK